MNTGRTSGPSPVRRLVIGAAMAALLWLPVVAMPPAAQAAACTGWSSTILPPQTVRVLRSSGVVQTVDFKTYVKVVMAAEWPPTWPAESLRAGAVTIKQYAWYYAIHYRGGTGTGGCFDVFDNSNDQIYYPEKWTPAAVHIQAVESTWGESLTKNGVFILTGYRPGTDVPCGSDAIGNRLFQKSARQCALAGKAGEEILHVYFDPGMVLQGAPTPPGAPTAAVAVPYDTSARVSWSAPGSDGGSPVTAYTVTSTPDGKTCQTAGDLTCAVSGLRNGTSYTFTVAATNIVGAGLPSDPSAAITPVPMTPPSTFHPLSPPVRMLDTRAGNGLPKAKLAANTPATFAITAQTRAGSLIPAGATAVTGNVTVVNSTKSWAVYLGPDPLAFPGTSTINFAAGQITGNGLTVALSGTGTLSATYMSDGGNTTDLVFDVTGYFTPDTSGATYHPMTPARLLDTRFANGLPKATLKANTPATFYVTAANRPGSPIPAGATAVTGNVTVVNETFAWAIFLGPDPTAAPGTSTINFVKGDIKGNNLTVALGAGGSLSATYVSNPGNTTDLVFDVTGYYTPDASGSRYVPLTPARLLDTRAANGLPGHLTANTPATFWVSAANRPGSPVPAGATAVTGNVTVVNETFPWAVFLGPVPNSAPGTSTINFVKGDIKGNGLAVALGSGGGLSATYMSTTGNTTDLVFDVTGYFAP
jgi:hypothetical protein